MDPLRISTLGIEHNTQPMKLRLNFKDLDIINMKSLILKKALYACQIISFVDLYLMFNYYSFNAVNYSMSIESEAQKPIVLEGMYEIDGRILILPIIGNGRCMISLGLKTIYLVLFMLL